MLIESLGHNHGIPQAVAAATAMLRAVVKALADPAARTGDIRGTGATEAMTRAAVSVIEVETADGRT